jgi:hypothetical protein
MNNELALVEPGPLMKVATDVAGLCREIVSKTALTIAKRKYVKVEGWQAIANGFGCSASARDVKKVFDDADDRFIGFRAIGEVKRNSDGAVIAQAEGFVGVDEPRWFGGQSEVWSQEKRHMVTKNFEPAPEYAVRAMCQTRAISRACRSAFAFVVVLIDEKLSTTPAEEAEGAEHEEARERTMTPAKEPAPNNGKDWRDYKCSYGTKDGPLRGKQLFELTDKNLEFLYGKFVTALSAEQSNALSDADKAMVEGLKLWKAAQEK